MKTLPFFFAPLLLFADLSNAPAPSLNNWITLGADYTRVHLDAGSQSTGSGSMGGFQGFYEYAPDNAFFGAVRFKYRQGSCGRRNLLDLSAAEYMGYSWAWKDWFCSAFTGFGFRYLGHEYKHSSLKLGYYAFYIPVGLIAEYTFNSLFTLVLYATWMPQAFPTANIQPPGGTFLSLRRTYGNVLIELPFVFTLDKIGSWNLSISPFFERWQDGGAAAGAPLKLSGNTYHFFGADINLIYGF